MQQIAGSSQGSGVRQRPEHEAPGSMRSYLQREGAEADRPSTAIFHLQDVHAWESACTHTNTHTWGWGREGFLLTSLLKPAIQGFLSNLVTKCNFFKVYVQS